MYAWSKATLRMIPMNVRSERSCRSMLSGMSVLIVFAGVISKMTARIYWSGTVSEQMYGKTTTPDEKFALEEPDDPETDYFPETPSRNVGAQRTYSFSPIAIFKLEALLEDMKVSEWERTEAERARQKSEDERVIQETKRELAERARERQETSREDADRKRERDIQRAERWSFHSANSSMKSPSQSP